MHKAVSLFLEAMDTGPTIDSRDLTYIPILTGRSAAILSRFDVNDRSYVLRILPSQASHLSRMHEIQLAQYAGVIGIGPKIHFVDPRLEALIMDFIPGRTVLPIDFQNTPQLGQFALLLQKLHRSSLQFPVACNPFQRFHNFLEKIKQRGVVLSPKFLQMKRIMETIEETLQLHEVPLVPCHLDLHALNIMMAKDDLFIVDWVNGGLSNPYFDLATFAFFHGLKDLQTSSFLTHYFGRTPSELEWSLFSVAQPVRLFVIAVACLSISQEEMAFYDDSLVGSEPISFKDYINMNENEKINVSPWKIGLIMLKAGLEQVDEKDFKNSLQYLQHVVLKDIVEKRTGP